MKITGREFLNALSEYFNRQDVGSDFFWILLLPGFIFMLWLFLYSNADKADKDPFDEIPSKDMDMLKQISSQKGLSDFDRDFLIMQALNIYVKPTKILLDKSTFERAELVLIDKAKRDGISPDSDDNVKSMKRLKSKLFN